MFANSNNVVNQQFDWIYRRCLDNEVLVCLVTTSTHKESMH